MSSRNQLVLILRLCSPFRPTSVKTKVEAFEAVLNHPVQTAQLVQNSRKESLKPVLPEARVLLRRLTDQELREAGAIVEKPGEGEATESAADKAPNDGTFVLEASEDEISSPEKPKEKERKVSPPLCQLLSASYSCFSLTQQTVTQILARKSVDKAKMVALAAARTKLMQSTIQDNPESVSNQFKMKFSVFKKSFCSCSPTYI